MEEVVIMKAVHRLTQSLQLEQKFDALKTRIDQVEGEVGPKVVDKISEIFSENLDDILPVLVPMKKRIEEIKSYVDNIEAKVNGAIDGAARATSAT